MILSDLTQRTYRGFLNWKSLANRTSRPAVFGDELLRPAKYLEGLGHELGVRDR